MLAPTKPLLLVNALLLVLAPTSLAEIVTVEPDDFVDKEDISTAIEGVKLTTVSVAEDQPPLPFSQVYAASAAEEEDEANDNKVFANYGGRHWYESGYQFRADFSQPTSYVNIRAAADGAYAARIFDAQDNELEAYEAIGSSTSAFEDIEFNRPTSDISYILVGKPSSPLQSQKQDEEDEQDAVVTSRRTAESASRLLLDTLQYDQRELDVTSCEEGCRGTATCYSAAELELPKLEQPHGYEYCDTTTSETTCRELCDTSVEVFAPIICRQTGPWLGNGCVGPLCALKARMCKLNAVRRRCNDRCGRVRSERIVLEERCRATCDTDSTEVPTVIG